MEPDPRLIDFSEHPAFFFDGVCNMCNSSVDFVMRHDKKKLFRFGSLQGETAQQVVPEFAAEAGLSTVVLVTSEGKSVRSTAVLRILKALGGFWGLLGTVGLWVPRPIRDWFYKRIANSRYKLYGKRDTCRIPTAAERELFLP